MAENAKGTGIAGQACNGGFTVSWEGAWGKNRGIGGLNRGQTGEFPISVVQEIGNSPVWPRFNPPVDELCPFVERKHVFRKNKIAAENVSRNMSKPDLASKAVSFFDNNFEFKVHETGYQRPAASVDCNSWKPV